VKFLVDQNRPPQLAEALRRAGHDAVHTEELGLERAPDNELFDRAAADGRIIISGDTDFTAMLAERGSKAPSLILFRMRGRRRAAEQAALLLANLDAVADDLNGGAIVVLQDERVRVRRLPFGNGPER
jgi:predicted nuclease of predicted toxin-antitoxin system